MADEIVYKKVTRKADKGLEGKVIAKHGKDSSEMPGEISVHTVFHVSSKRYSTNTDTTISYW